MTTKATLASWSLPGIRPDAAVGWQSAFSLALGAAFTAGLFASIAWYENATRRPEPTIVRDLGIAMMPVTPPPPPKTAPVDPVPDPLPVAGFDLAPSSSAVKIEASPPPLELLNPQELSKPPQAHLELRLPESFRPRAHLQEDINHIYQRYEVDQPPTVLVENAPQVTDRIMDGADALRVVLIWVIEADGTVTNVRVAKSSGKPKFDALMMTMIGESVFTPAMKGGRKVRMMTQQQITVKWSEGSPFHEL